MNFISFCDISLKGQISQYVLREIIIISPYLSKFFFQTLNTLNPDKVYIITDAECLKKDIQDVKDVLNERLIQFRFAKCKGIVHAKLFFFLWHNITDDKAEEILLWGSCNATDAAFNRNAEVYSWISERGVTSQKTWEEIVNYFNRLKYEKNVKGGIRELSDGIHINLPSLNFIAERISYDTFDDWIQNGMLCHPFPNDPLFRHFKIKVNKALENDNKIEKIFRNSGLYLMQHSTISYDYIRKTGKETEKNNSNKVYESIWKAKFFTDTIFGYWTSDECFNNKKHLFRKYDKYDLENEINLIANSTEEQYKLWIEEFIEIILKVAKQLQSPEIYFYYKNNILDAKKYRMTVEEQIKRDIIRSRDEWFRFSYITGNEFYDIPPMRTFSQHWKKFIISLCNALLFEIVKPLSRNFLAKTLNKLNKNKIIVLDNVKNGEDLLNFMRANWEQIRNEIIYFYPDEKDSVL